MSKPILIGCDGSEGSRDALELGAVLARSLDAVPLAASIVPYSNLVLSQEKVDEVVERVSAPFLKMAREHLGEFDFENRAALNVSPAAGLDALAEDEDALLIVVGSGHRGTLGRMLLGSVGRSLLAGAPCPVAVPPRGYAGDGEHRISSIGVGFDGSDEARGALGVAVALAKELEAQISVIGALEPINPYHYPVSPFDADSYLSAAAKSLEDAVDEAVELCSDEELTARHEIVRGDPSHAIAEAAADDDLLVLGSRRFGPMARTFLGSVSAGVMEHASCPVLIVPRGADAPVVGLEPPGRSGNSG